MRGARNSPPICRSLLIRTLPILLSMTLKSAAVMFSSDAADLLLVHREVAGDREGVLMVVEHRMSSMWTLSGCRSIWPCRFV